jgi:hypothetical protein
MGKPKHTQAYQLFLVNVCFTLPNTEYLLPAYHGNEKITISDP